MSGVEIDCPQCGFMTFALDSFEHIIVVGRGQAVGTYRCPICDQSLATPIDLSPELARSVDLRIRNLTFEHPKSNLERFCVSEDLRNEEQSARVFGEKLAQIETVEDLLGRIAADDARDSRT